MARPKKVVTAPQAPVSTPATTTVMSRLMAYGALVQETQEIVQHASAKVSELLQGYEQIYLMVESSNGTAPVTAAVDFSTMSSKDLRAFMREHNLEVDDFADMDELSEKQLAVAEAYADLVAGASNHQSSQVVRQPVIAPRAAVARPVAGTPDPHMPWFDPETSEEALPDFDEMNVKDLQAFINKHTLDVSLADYLSIGDKRQAVAAAYVGEDVDEEDSENGADENDDENY